MPLKKLGDRIESIRQIKNSSRWRLRYVLDGARREEHYGSKSEANTRADVIRDRIATAKTAKAAQTTTQAPQGIKLGKGSIEDWSNLIWYCAVQVVRRPDNEDWQRAGRAISTMAGEARQQAKTKATLDPSEDADEIAQLSDEELREQITQLTVLSGGKGKGDAG